MNFKPARSLGQNSWICFMPWKKAGNGPGLKAASMRTAFRGLKVSSSESLHSEVTSFLTADQREHGSERVLTVDDPAAAGYLHGAVEDFAAAGFNALDGCFN